MSWEKRGQNGPYYTESKRINGKIKRSYIGQGELADIAAQWDQIARENREFEQYCQKELKKEEAQKRQEINQALTTLANVTDALVEEALKEAGFHNHKGQWRKKRDGKKNGAS